MCEHMHRVPQGCDGARLVPGTAAGSGWGEGQWLAMPEDVSTQKSQSGRTI